MNSYDVTCHLILEVKVKGIQAASEPMAAMAAACALSDRFNEGVSIDLVSVQSDGCECPVELECEGDNICSFKVESDDGFTTLLDKDFEVTDSGRSDAVRYAEINGL